MTADILNENAQYNSKRVKLLSEAIKIAKLSLSKYNTKYDMKNSIYLYSHINDDREEFISGDKDNIIIIFGDLWKYGNARKSEIMERYWKIYKEMWNEMNEKIKKYGGKFDEYGDWDSPILVLKEL